MLSSFTFNIVQCKNDLLECTLFGSAAACTSIIVAFLYSGTKKLDLNRPTRFSYLKSAGGGGGGGGGGG